MAIVKFDTESFIKSIEPGLPSFVIQQFHKKLDEKINGIIADVHKEMCAELPDKIKGMIFQALDPISDQHRIKVIVEIKDLKTI